MCGIAGIIPHDPAYTPPLEEIDQMIARLHHRGPDDTGSIALAGASLGLKRLSIIDVEGGHQPLFNEDRRIAFVGNGEIYNYRELREELTGKGHRFATGSDMEVVVHGYETWGDDVASHLGGQFAFALWDSKRKRLLAARDRAGEKPFYYYEGKHNIVFASEIKALLVRDDVPRRLDLEGLDTFLTYEFIIAPHTIFQGIRKLPPAHLMVIEGEKLPSGLTGTFLRRSITGAASRSGSNSCGRLLPQPSNLK